MTNTMQLSADRFSELAHWIKNVVPEHQFGAIPYAELGELAVELLSGNKRNTYLMGLLGDEPDTHEVALTDALLRVARGYAKYSSCYPTISVRDRVKRAKHDWLDKCIEDYLESIAQAEAEAAARAEAEEINRLERAFQAPAANLQPAERP